MDGRPILSHCFDDLVDVGIGELVVVVGYRGQDIADHYGDTYRDTPITYEEQPEQLGLAHALLAVEDHIEDDFVLMLGDNVFDADLQSVLDRQREPRTDAAFLVEEVPYEEASRYGVCDTNDYGEIVAVEEKPDDPPTNLVLTRFYTFSPAISHACELVEPSDCGEYELTDAIDLLLRSGRTIDVLGLDGWRVDVGYPEDRDRAEALLQDGVDATTAPASEDEATSQSD